MLIDTHSHINMDKLADILPEIIQNLDKGLVQRVICPSFSLNSSKSAFELADKYDKVFCALGIHPENANEYSLDFEDFFTQNANNKKVVAVGEIGLDYHYGKENRQAQINCLDRQILLAKQFDLPIIFHIRDAWQDFFSWLKDYRGEFSKGVVHCFESNADTAIKVLENDLILSFTGLVTFKPREDIRLAVKEIPLDKIMVETDAPYLAPEPFRGRLNRPEYTEYVARKIAEIKNIEFEEVCEQTTQNAYKFFDKMREFDGK